MAKRRVGSQIAKFYLCAGGLQHIVGKFSTRSTTLLQTLFRLEVHTQSYGPSKSRESELWEFQDSHLGVPGENDIWVLVPWLGIEYTIRGRWWLPQSLNCGEFCESCESVFARGLFVHQKRSNYALTNLLFGLCRSMWVIDVCHFLSPHPRAPACPSTPKVLWAKECAQLFILLMFSLQTHIWINQGALERVIVITCTHYASCHEIINLHVILHNVARNDTS
jgi:hypothetical protein